MRLKMEEDSKRLDPKIFQAIQLDEIAQGIKKLVKLMGLTIPEGKTETYELTATTSTEEVRPPVGKKWIKVSVFNKGPETAKIGINVGSVNAVTIEKDKSYEIDMKVPRIEYVNYRTDSGEASITIDGLR